MGRSYSRLAVVTGADSGIGQATAFLASPRSSYVTGTSTTVDGGLTLMAAHGHDTAGPQWREL
jgi:NAD(P)-dependent dehydrogenase (short-subunit alcohol dehydrogenase family)